MFEIRFSNILFLIFHRSSIYIPLISILIHPLIYFSIPYVIVRLVVDFLRDERKYFKLNMFGSISYKGEEKEGEVIWIIPRAIFRSLNWMILEGRGERGVVIKYVFVMLTKLPLFFIIILNFILCKYYILICHVCRISPYFLNTTPLFLFL